MKPIENIYEVYDGKVSIEIGTGENGLDEDKVYVGIHSTIPDSGDVKEYSIEELLKLDDKLEECFDPRDIKIIAGEASC